MSLKLISKTLNTFARKWKRYIHQNKSKIAEKEKNDRDFFLMCEHLLSNPDLSPKFFPGLNQKIIYLIASNFGLLGILAAYVILISKKSKLYFTCFKNTLIFDVRGRNILQREEIRKETRTLIIRREHFPSWRIVKEIASAYSVYRQQRKSPKTDTSVSKRATSNEMYLFWFVNFYAYRSIILSNEPIIKSEIRCAASVFHPTPELNGCLSMLSNLDIPLVAYISHKVIKQEVYSYSLPFFDRVIVRNGRCMDLLVKSQNTSIFLEDSGQQPSPLLLCKEKPIAAVLLSSFYMLSDSELDIFVSQNLIPCLIDFQSRWRSYELKVYCHPNDVRPQKIVERCGLNASLDEDQIVKRLKSCSVVLAGNTTAIDEVLAASIPVIYVGKLDAFHYDLLGYVSDGIVYDGTERMPHQEDVARFYADKRTQINLQRYLRGCIAYPSVRLVDALDTTQNSI